MSTSQSSTPGGGTPQGGPGQPKGIADEARQEAREMTDQVAQQARAKGEEMRERMEEKGEEQKDRMAGTAEAVAEAIRAAGSTLRERHEDRLGEFTDEFAAQVDRFSGYLRDNDIGGLMHSLEDVARRNPTGFLGSTLAAGLVAGRFLRSSAHHTEPHAQSGGGSTIPHRPPSHQEFTSNAAAPEVRTSREGIGSSQPAREPSSGRETAYTAGGPRP